MIKRRKNEIKNLISSQKFLWGLILVVCFTVFSSFYVPYVIMPQQGWWQYYASCVLDGDVLYKDVYLYMPPYYVFFVAVFYPLFKSHFFLYTVFVGYPIKVLCLLFLYKCILRMTKPAYAAISVFAGAILSATFLMDAWFDYNPVLSVLCVLYANCIMEYYSTKENARNRLWYAGCIGLFCGVLLMSKHTLGISFGVLSLLMIGILHIKEHIPGTIRAFLSWLCGYFIGLLPGIIYFVYHDCWSDFLNCLNIATGAKGGMIGLFDHLISCLSYKSVWVIVLSAFLLILVTEYDLSGNEVHRGIIADQKTIGIIKAVLVSLLLLGVGRVFSADFSNVFSTIRELRAEAYIVVAVLCVLLYNRFERSHGELPPWQSAVAGVVVLLGAMFLCSTLSGDRLGYLYNCLDIFGMRRKLIVVLSYLFVLLWLWEMFRYFIQRKKDDYSVLMFWTVMAMHFFVNIISSSVIEEIFMVLYVPFVLAALFESKASRKKVKNRIIIGCVLLLTVLSLICKLYIPYDWQGWRVTPVAADDVYCDVEGLEGLKVSQENNELYGEIVELILEETTENDAVYSFGNTALFNILSDRKSPVFAPIPWFDVCPDKIAEADAKRLEDELPKIIVWQNMDESQWTLLEEVFRNGERSGQRAIKELYDTVVKNNYTMEIEAYNHRDGTLQVWKRNETVYTKEQLARFFGGGTGTQEDPFIVKTASQLEKVRDMVNSGYCFENQFIEQATDIDLSGVKNWIPIGLYDSENQFKGTYDGRGHVIKNLYCRSTQNAGLFGCLAGTVCNLGVVDSYIKGSCVGVISSNAYSGAARIINCYTISEAEGVRAGGIADNFSGSIINCISYSKCTGQEAAGAVSYQNGTLFNVWGDYTCISSDILNSYGSSYVGYMDMDNLSEMKMLKRMNEGVRQNGTELDLVKWRPSEDGYPILISDRND